MVMKWAINQKIQNERTQHDPMDCSHVPLNSAQYSDWSTPEDWKSAADATWGPSNQDTSTESTTDVNYAYSKGKGKGDMYSQGGKGQGKQQNSLQYHMMMAMKAMKGGGKEASTQEPKEPRDQVPKVEVKVRGNQTTESAITAEAKDT